jgi:serine protease Do
MMKRLSITVVLVLSGTCLGVLVGRSGVQGQAAAPPPVPRELTSYRDIVKGVLPAVVSIESRARPEAPGVVRPRLPTDPRVPEQFRRSFEDIEPQQFSDPSPRRLGFGSGFLVDASGVILTNNHVVDGAVEVVVRLKDGRRFTSKNIKTDAKSDLAIVRIDAQKLPFLRLGDSNQMEIGDRVLAVGAPFGLVGSVTQGIISGKDRSLRMNLYEDFVQTDAAINPGNSGGPLINMAGQVIGINAAIKTRSGGFQGVGLAVSSNLARDVMQRLLKDGVVHRGYLGVQINDITDRDLAQRLGLGKDEHGVLVTRIFADAPGAKGGVKEGDVITTVNGDKIQDGRDLQWTIARLPVGKVAKVRVLREGKPVVLDVTIEEQPEKLDNLRSPLPRSPAREPDSVSIDSVGMAVADLTPELADRLGYKRLLKGAVVTRIKRNSPAILAALVPGLVVTKVDDTPIDSAVAFKAAVEKGSLSKGVLLQIHSPRGGINYVLLKTDGQGK